MTCEKEASGSSTGVGKMILVATMRKTTMCRRMALRRNPELISRSLIFWEREDDLERGILGLAVIGTSLRRAASAFADLLVLLLAADQGKTGQLTLEIR